MMGVVWYGTLLPASSICQVRKQLATGAFRPLMPRLTVLRGTFTGV